MLNLLQKPAMQNPKHAGSEVRKEEEQGLHDQARAGAAGLLQRKSGCGAEEAGQGLVVEVVGEWVAQMSYLSKGPRV